MAIILPYYTRVITVLGTSTKSLKLPGQTNRCNRSGRRGGPSLLLAYADIDYLAGNSSALSFGPEGVTVTAVDNLDGNMTITVDGTFPATTGTLLVSNSSDQGVGAVANVGTIDSWSTTQIVLTVLQYNIASGALDGEDFSFAILGR
ncbi:MAG: hypothetical protein P1R58_09395 [bacterium]|nr:hypothetical protein [bacterium]